LGGLTREEVPAYLSHRLQLAGCSLPLFEPAAIEALFQATQGLPRPLPFPIAALGSQTQISERQISVRKRSPLGDP
jgi:hypothetical protein